MNTSLKILLIEDDEVDVKSFRRSLDKSKKRHSLQTASTLQEALDLIKSDKPDIVVSDLGLPDSTGQGTYEKLLCYPELPVVVLTGLDDEELAQNAINKGAQDYLVKGSFNHIFLMRTINYAIERKKLFLKLEDLSKRKDEFLSTVSHELRTPLTILTTAISNIKDFHLGELPEECIKIVKMMEANAKRLGRLINDMLDLARLESGRSKMKRSYFKIDELVAELVENHQIIAKEKGLSLKQDISSQNPQIWADSDMIAQVIINLLSNALAYAKSEIMVRVKFYDQFVQVSVEDDGIGISLEDQKDLFDKFVQVDRALKTGGGYKGTGLGLAISKKIVDEHHGNIWVKSSLDEGAQFHFSLPRDLRKSE